MLGGHVLHLGDEAAQIGAQRFDRLVDEGLLPRELFELGVEIAFTEFLDAGHGLFLDRDMTGDHVVDALRHRGEAALEGLDRDRHIDVTAVMFCGHVCNGLTQAVDRTHGCFQERIDGFQHFAGAPRGAGKIGASGKVAPIECSRQTPDLFDSRR